MYMTVFFIYLYIHIYLYIYIHISTALYCFSTALYFLIVSLVFLLFLYCFSTSLYCFSIVSLLGDRVLGGADLCVIDRPLCEDQNSLLSFQSICSIHQLMDDDADGSVDTTETDEVRGRERRSHWGPRTRVCNRSLPQFLREDLMSHDPKAKHSSFHRADLHISVEDMWAAWKGSTGETPLFIYIYIYIYV